MSERRPEEIKVVDEDVLVELSDKYQEVLNNLMMLHRIFAIPDIADRHIQIEAISSSIDLGGFFMDEIASDPRCRESLDIGPEGGDVIVGTANCLVKRPYNGKDELQLQVNVATRTGSALGYFRLEQTLAGCFITQPLTEFIGG